MKTKTILACTVALTMSACSSGSSLYENSGPRYTPRPDVAQRNYTSVHHAQDHRDEIAYKEYEEREPCQNYRKLPRNMIDRCDKTEKDLELANTQIATQTRTLPIVSSYTILFDHDESYVRNNEHATLDRALRDIAKYNPSQVTVTGYTDSSGDAAYNQTLSRQREQAVSKALLARGISNYTLDREARGEFDQAVQTQDGVRNQDNRRVVIDFRR